MHVARDFVIGEFGAQIIDDFTLGNMGAFFCHDVGDRLFAFAGVGFTDDRSLLERGQLVEDFLDLAWVDIDPVDEEHVLLAVGDVEVAVGLAVSDVPGEQPAIADRLGGLLRFVPVTEHDITAADANFTDFAIGEDGAGIVLDADLDVGDCDADGASLPGTADGVKGDDGTGFAEAVTFDERDFEGFSELAKDLTGQGGGTTDAETQGEGLAFEAGGERAKELGDGGQQRGAVSDDLVQNVLGWMHGTDEHDGTADDQGQEQADAEHEAVEHGEQDHEPILVDGFEHLSATLDIMEEVPMGEHGTLGFAGGAAGIDDDGELVGFAIRSTHREALGNEGIGGGNGFDMEGVETVNLGFEGFEGGIHAFFADEHLDAGVFEDVFDLVGLEEVIDGHDDGTGFENADHAGDELGSVFEPDADAITGFDAQRMVELVRDPP